MSNIYDNPAFFDSYSRMSRSKYGLNGAGECRTLKPMIGDLTGKSVLDIGCGYGWHCRYAAEKGALSVVGFDGSEKMIARAERINKRDNITYIVKSAEEFGFLENSYDFVISNLVLHYIEDLDDIYGKIFLALKPSGEFVFNIEHPVFTAGVRQEWIADENGNNLYWPVDNYYYPGRRITDFLGHDVKKYHHTLTQILGGLLNRGFAIADVREAMPPRDMLDNPGMADEMRRPMMLLVKAVKK